MIIYLVYYHRCIVWRGGGIMNIFGKIYSLTNMTGYSEKCGLCRENITSLTFLLGVGKHRNLKSYVCPPGSHLGGGQKAHLSRLEVFKRAVTFLESGNSFG